MREGRSLKRNAATVFNTGSVNVSHTSGSSGLELLGTPYRICLMRGTSARAAKCTRYVLFNAALKIARTHCLVQR
eukprot:14423939-Alexandrium_andersonii.AAC.1